MTIIRSLEEKIENLEKEVARYKDSVDRNEKEIALIKESNLQRDIQITNLMTSITGLLRMGQSKERVTFGSVKCKEQDISRVIGELKPKTFSD